MLCYISGFLKLKVWIYYWMVMFFLLGVILMNMMCNCVFYFDLVDLIVVVVVRSIVFLNF